jgi:hypothetical protein
MSRNSPSWLSDWVVACLLCLLIVLAGKRLMQSLHGVGNMVAH